MSTTPNDWARATLTARWKAAKAGHEVPVRLSELDRLEAMFGDEPNEATPDARLFWGAGVLRPPAKRGGPHSFYLRDYTPPE